MRAVTSVRRRAVGAARHGQATGAPRRPANGIATHANGYVLELEPDELDATRFERTLAEARERATAGETEEASQLFERALALWRGRALAGLSFESYASTDVERLEELRLAALVDRIDCELALSRHDLVIGELEQLVAEHPLKEQLHGQRMLALYRSGRQAEALRAYRDARRRPACVFFRRRPAPCGDCRAG